MMTKQPLFNRRILRKLLKGCCVIKIQSIPHLKQTNMKLKTLYCYCLVFFALLFACPSTAVAQTTNGNHRAFGYYFSLDGQWHNPTNLNRILQNNGLPETRRFLAGFGAGWLFQFNRFELSIDATAIGRASTRSDVRQQQMFGLFALGAKYLLGSGTTQFYPVASIGYATGSMQFSQENTVRDINAVLTTSRNTTSLYNRQGFASLGAGVRFGDSAKRSFLGIEAGYRLGFSGTPWSSRMNSSYLTNSVTDELRQFYVRVVFGFFRKKRP
jgi:hypothetical protein